MKKSKYIFTLACLLGMALQGCQQDSNPGSDYAPSLTARYVAIETNALSFGASTNLTQSLKVTAVTTPWQFTGMDSWLKLSPATGNESATVQAVAEENTSGDNSRTCILTFSSAASDYSYSTSVQATQNYAEPYITLSENSLAFDGRAATATVTVKSNISWTATPSTDWLTVEATSDGGSITVKVAENITNAARQATVTLTGKTTVTLTVAQVVAKIEGDQATLTYAQAGGTYQLSIASEASWTASTEQTWIQVDPAEGAAGTTEVLVSATPNESTNERKGWITFCIGGEKRIEIAVIQEGNYFDVTEGSKATIPSTGGTHTVTFKTSKQWTVTSNSSWLTASPEQGQGHGSVSWTAGDHPSVCPRTDTSYINPDGLQAVPVITTQAARYLRLDHTCLSFFAKGGTSEKIVVETDAAYTITNETPWLTIQQDGNTFTATAEAYTEKTQREGKITLTMTGLKAGESYKIDLPVTQYAEGAHFTIEHYSDNENWNLDGETGAVITVTGFGGDEDWNVK